MRQKVDSTRVLPTQYTGHTCFSKRSLSQYYPEVWVTLQHTLSWTAKDTQQPSLAPPCLPTLPWNVHTQGICCSTVLPDLLFVIETSNPELLRTLSTKPDSGKAEPFDMSFRTYFETLESIAPLVLWFCPGNIFWKQSGRMDAMAPELAGGFREGWWST